jgi:hypothetical protein
VLLGLAVCEIAMKTLTVFWLRATRLLRITLLASALTTLAVLLLAFLFVALVRLDLRDVPDRIRGRSDAHFDLARGDYKELTWGLPVDWFPEYSRLLRERYGIEERRVAFCVVSQSLVAYAEGYNTVSRNAAIRKFGRDIFKESMADASRAFTASEGIPASREKGGTRCDTRIN